MSAQQEFCPNWKRHADEGERWQRGTALYKKSQRAHEFRMGFESDQQQCEFCWPTCPTCGHRERRKESR